MLCDMEAGAGTLLRLEPGQVDVVLVVAEPTVKSIEAARRLAEVASTRSRVLVVANRVRSAEDERAIRDALGTLELVVVPDEPAIERADRDGLAPIDVAPDAPGVRALRALAARVERLAA